MSLDKAAFFALYKPAKPVVHRVDMPDGNAVYVREMGAHERTVFDLSMSTLKDPKANHVMRERLVVQCACNEDGVELFNEVDVQTVGMLPQSVVEPIFQKAWEINDLGPVDLDKLKKSSEKTPASN